MFRLLAERCVNVGLDNLLEEYLRQLMIVIEDGIPVVQADGWHRWAAIIDVCNYL